MQYQINKLSLYHFKNYDQVDFDFENKIICISGLNGCGKTSVLDAIYLLCFTKSYFIHSDAMLVKKGEVGMRVQGLFKGDAIHEVKCVLRENGKKEFSLDGELYSQFSKHVGKYSCVMIAPDDTQIITEGSEVRRKFVDQLIAQIDSKYMKLLINYTKSLAQRNAYLKQLAGNLHEVNHALIGIYNEQLVEAANYIFKQRVRFVEAIKTKSEVIHNYLSGSSERVHLQYVSTMLHRNLLDDLTINLAKDVYSQRTNYGIHKDDVIFELNNMPFKQVASQGQRKSFLFGLKLAQFELIFEETKSYPILLLDDVFEKLDTERSNKLIQYVINHEAQVFITDTNHERLIAAFDNNHEDIQFLKI